MRKMFSKNQIKEIVNQGIESGEIHLPKGSQYSIEKVYHEDNEFWSWIIHFEKGFFPIYFKIANDLEEGFGLYWLANGDSFDRLDEAGISAGIMNVTINDNESTFEIELNEELDPENYHFVFCVGLPIKGEYAIVN